MEFDFQKYIQSRRDSRGGGPSGNRGFRDYAFGRDVKVLRTLERTRVVGMALKATARLEETWLRQDVMDKADKVGPGSFPHVRELCHDVAKNLGMATPTAWVSEGLGGRAAVTVQLDGASHILLSNEAVETFEDGELAFLIGQQCGHLLNGHVPYTTCAFALDQTAEAFYGWLVKPARIALDSWRRLGDVTADRAGLLACRDMDAARGALARITGVDDDEAETLPPAAAPATEPDEGPENEEEAGEEEASAVDGKARRKRHAFRSRLEALQAFERSTYYRHAVGLTGGEALTEVDKEVEKRLRLV